MHLPLPPSSPVCFAGGGVCAHPQTEREHIVSPELLKALDGMGVETVMMDPIPTTKYTEGIPGGACLLACGLGGPIRSPHTAPFFCRPRLPSATLTLATTNPLP
jgi:hypothetical protein